MLHHLKDEKGQIISNKKDIADTLGKNFEQCSSSDNYCSEFKKLKDTAENLTLISKPMNIANIISVSRRGT